VTPPESAARIATGNSVAAVNPADLRTVSSHSVMTQNGELDDVLFQPVSRYAHAAMDCSLPEM
jgi:hypothetical protein